MALRDKISFDQQSTQVESLGGYDSAGNFGVRDDVLLESPSGGGGSSRPVNIIRGCTDPTSLNYNPLATVDDGSCSYAVPTQPIKDKSIELTLNANESFRDILLNGKRIELNLLSSTQDN